jgi:lysophospholipase L1-like esterase
MKKQISLLKWITAIAITSNCVLAKEPATQAPPNPVATPSVAPAATPKPTPKPRTPESAITPTIKNPERHQKFLAQAKQGNIDLLFLGDSITDGWPGKGPESWKKFAPYHPADFGISADRTEHVLWRIENGELDGISPKVTVILIGTNNTGQCPDEKPEWAANGVTKIVDTVHEKLPKTKVLLLAVFPCGIKNTPRRQKVEQINKIISKLDDRKQTRFLDIGSKFLDEKGEIPPDVMPDKLHPTAKGYDIWYEAMKPLLDEMMR